MDPFFLLGIESLGRPRSVSSYEEQGTSESGYEEHGPYHCEDCIHKTASDEPFCIHPRVIADPRLQDRLVRINERAAVKVDLEHGCCKYVNQPLEDEDEDDEDEHDENGEENDRD